MTGYTVHTGSNEKFREGWDKIFRSQSKQKKQATCNIPKKKTLKGK